MNSGGERPTRSRSTSRGGPSTTSTPSSPIRPVRARGLDHADRAGPGHHPAAARVLVTGIHHRHPAVLANMAARAGHHLRRQTGARRRRRVERAGVAGPTASNWAVSGAVRPLRGGLPIDHRPAQPETTDFEGRFYRLTAARNELKRSAAAPADLHRRHGEKQTPAHHREVRPALELRRRHSGGIRPARCPQGALRRRGPQPQSEIMLSAHLRLDPERGHRGLSRTPSPSALRDLDLAIVYLPTPHDPAVLEPLAEAIRDSGLWRLA